MALTRDRLIELLNQDLASEYGAIIQYLTYAARVTGPNRNELSEFLRDEIAGETAHATFLSEKIVALGVFPILLSNSINLPCFASTDKFAALTPKISANSAV